MRLLAKNPDFTNNRAAQVFGQILAAILN